MRKLDPPRDRIAAAHWAAEALADPRTVVLDTETTGRGPGKEIVQVNVLGISGDVLMNTLVRPIMAIPDEAIAIHHITNEMVTDAPIFRDVHPQLVNVLAGRRLLIYNERFDWPLIQTECDRSSLPHPAPALIECAMLKYAAWYGEINYRYMEYRWQKLSGGDHSALGDCVATIEALRRMAAILEVEHA